MRTILFLFSLFLISLSIPAFAETQDPILSMPDGQVILNISATVRKEVEQDLLVANLSYITLNKDARALQNEINIVMADALKKAKKVDSVKVNTSIYQVYEQHDPRTKEKKWRGQQSMTLKSKNADDLLELVGDLQDMKLNMNGLSYMLSPEAAVKIKDNLMESALKQLQNRANRAAKALGKSSAEIRDVTVHNGGVSNQHQNYGRSAMMAMVESDMAMAAPPVAASGDSKVTLSVNARVLLKP